MLKSTTEIYFRETEKMCSFAIYEITYDLLIMKILIICTGNSCRSQMAHGFLQSLSPNLEVYSAGTNPAPCVNAKAIIVMSEIGIDISSHRPININKYLSECWDYVITVCGGANERCPAFLGKVTHRLHLGFEDPSEAVGSEEFIYNEFRRIRDEIRDVFTQFYHDISK